jgi:hypothetical protein
MPLVLDPANHPVERLRELFVEQRTGLSEIQDRVASLPAEVRRDPASYRTLNDLLTDAQGVLDRIDPATADAATLAAGANLGYSVMLSAIDLMKSHADMPTVPLGPKRSA